MTRFNRTSFGGYLEGLMGIRGNDRALRVSDLEGLVAENAAKVIQAYGKEPISDMVAGLLVAGANVTLTYNDAAGTLTIASTGGGGGISDGDKGDITVSASGATWTIDTNVVTLSKMADLATSTILGRVTAGTGDPEALTPTQVRTLINVANGATANATDAALRDRATHTGTQAVGTITGLAAVATSGSAADLGSGTLPAARLPAFGSGDVSFAVSGGAGTIAADAVTNAKLANVATATIKGRVTAATGDPEDLTGTQATTLLDTFTSALKGLAPASGGGTTNFLRADGTWAAPGGGGAANYAGHSPFAPAAGLFVTNNANATALGTQAQVADRTIIAPFVPGYGFSIDQMGVSVSTLLAASNAKCVIFDTDASGRPTTLLRETANISAAAAATVMSATFTTLALTAGKTYWIGIRASGTFTLRTLAVGALPALDYTNAATPVARQVLIRTETFATGAATWSYASSQHSTALMPLVLMRVA